MYNVYIGVLIIISIIILLCLFLFYMESICASLYIFHSLYICLHFIAGYIGSFPCQPGKKPFLLYLFLIY